MTTVMKQTRNRKISNKRAIILKIMKQVQRSSTLSTEIQREIEQFATTKLAVNIEKRKLNYRKVIHQ